MVTGATDPPNGAVVVNANNTITYSPDAGFLGSDSFTYTITDGRNCFRTATVNVTVTEKVNRAPDAVDDMATTQENTAVTINVVGNDSDPDGDPFTVTNVTQGSNGVVTNNNNGTVTYQPNSGFTGNDSFTYTITDNRNASDTATVRVTVSPRPVSEEGKVTGGGWIPCSNGKSNFGFNAQSNSVVKGRISYGTCFSGDEGTEGDDGDGDASDGDRGQLRLSGTIESLHIAGSAASFNGSGTLGNGRQVRFTVDVEDNGEPGAGRDRFKIRIFDAITGALMHQNNGSLGGGNIQIH